MFFFCLSHTSGCVVLVLVVVVLALVIPLDLMVLVVVGVLVAVNVDMVMAVAIVVRVPCVLHVWIFVLFYHSPVAGGCRGVGDNNYGSCSSLFCGW